MAACAAIGQFGVKVPAMHAIKSIAKSMFLGAFVLGLMGGFVGGVAALFIWPGSNLGPPVGAIYGVFWGVVAGAVLGFAWGMMRMFKSGPRVSEPNCNAKAP
jgi:hypothetical protein